MTFGVATGEEAWELYVNMLDMEKEADPKGLVSFLYRVS